MWTRSTAFSVYARLGLTAPCVTPAQITAAPSLACTESVSSSSTGRNSRYAFLISFHLAFRFLFLSMFVRAGSTAHVKPAGRARTVNEKRTSVCRTHARMEEPVMTD